MNWQTLIEILRFTNKDVINNDCIKEWLDSDIPNLELRTLDELFILDVLTKEEYIDYLRKMVAEKYHSISFLNYIISQATAAEDYSPLDHYGPYTFPDIRGLVRSD